MSLREVVLVDYLRTPFSWSKMNKPVRDKLNNFYMDKLTGKLIKTMIDRKGINPKEMVTLLFEQLFQLWNNGFMALESLLLWLIYQNLFQDVG